MTADQSSPALVLSNDQAAILAADLRSGGRRVVFTNGCFDLLHAGHVDYLQRARSLGDVLFVGLNSDESVRHVKGPGRPILLEEDRVALLAALRAVDVVTVFYEPTAELLVGMIRPDVYVKGGDWGTGGQNPPEAAVVQRSGGKVVYLPYVAGRSTSMIIEHIRKRVP